MNALTRSDNVLDNQRILAQTRLMNTQALDIAGRGAARGAASLGNALTQLSPAGQQMQQNALAQSEAQTQVARAQGLQAEAAIVAPYLSQIEQSANPAETYAQVVRLVEAKGVDIAEPFETYSPENFQMVKSIYTLPPQEMTDFERILQGLGSDEERMQAIRIKAGVALSAGQQAQAQNSGAFNLGPGQGRYDADGNVIAEREPAAPKPPAGYRLTADGSGYEFIPDGPADPAVIERNARARGPATQITIGDGQALPKPPEGTVWQMGANGKPVLDERGAPIAIPFQGGPAMADAQAAGEKAEGRRQQAMRAANVVTEDIGRAVQIIQNSNWPTTGLFGAALSRLPGSGAHDLNKMMDTIKSNSAFDALAQMRANSPTGGALGAVSERELGLLQSTIGSLEQSQGQQQVLDNLARVHNTYLDIVFGAGEGPKRMPVEFRSGDVSRRLDFLSAQYPDDPGKVQRIMQSEGLL